MWKQKLGVATELANFEWKTYINLRKAQEFDLARSGWCGDYNEASTFLDLLTTTHGANDGKYSSPRVDELMSASKTAEDPSSIYAEVEQILAEDMAIIPIYHYANTFLLSSDIQGLALQQRGEQLVFQEPLPHRQVSDAMQRRHARACRVAG